MNRTSSLRNASQGQAGFFSDEGQNKGLRRITVNQGALVETLIQLSNFRHYAMAESLLTGCTREQLQALFDVAERAFSRRLIYSLEKQFKKTGDSANKIKGVLLAELMKILNAWCKEGHRSAVRSVLMELHAGEVVALGRMPDLDREVQSMLHEYGLPYAVSPCRADDSFCEELS
ncbi:hypothetical protein DWU98_10945 [Dyella monticola]|uniref:Uncharacterized protein n=1 Tax=Dyella monticola TaxID=1927958 RepID=A0A370X046_9GAMM|nr:hypothetical protein [Dyella monticola]RDS81726.1 hypothetical protein DWU98_10945 [Dyella monticola]